jgi:type IV pilus assembly protein PilX
MNAPRRRFSVRARERGAALVVGLVLLMVITVLAISGMNTATIELQMAGNFQYAQGAFQAAEVGIERAMKETTLKTNHDAPMISPAGGIHDSTTDSFTTEVVFVAPSMTPKPGFSMGPGGFQAYHFDVTSNGTSARNARAENTQSFFIIGPNY